MAIFFEELKQSLKPFVFWMIGLAFLMLAGMGKFSAMATSPDAINALFDSWPKVVLATFGAVGLEVTTLSGYFGMMWMYAALTVAVYAIGLGMRLTTLEVSDKNTDFVYAKPKSRAAILTYKLAAHVLYMLVFVAASYAFTVLGLVIDKTKNTISTEINLLSIALVFIAFIYYAIAALAGAITAKYGGLIAYIVLLSTYMGAVFYDIATKGENIIRVLTPLKYFNPVDVISAQALNTGYIALSVGVISATLLGAYVVMSRKDF